MTRPSTRLRRASTGVWQDSGRRRLEPKGRTRVRRKRTAAPRPLRLGVPGGPSVTHRAIIICDRSSTFCFRLTSLKYKCLCLRTAPKYCRTSTSSVFLHNHRNRPCLSLSAPLSLDREIHQKCELSLISANAFARHPFAHLLNSLHFPLPPSATVSSHSAHFLPLVRAPRQTIRRPCRLPLAQWARVRLRSRRSWKRSLSNSAIYSVGTSGTRRV